MAHLAGQASPARRDQDDEQYDTQPNTSTPFYKCMHDMLQSTQAQELPAIELVDTLLGCLANQEAKLHAMDAGMMSAAFQLYDTSLRSAAADTVPLREKLVAIVRSFVLLQRGRQMLHEQIGLARTLAWLEDPAPSVRGCVCALLAALASFPDSRLSCQAEDGAMLKSLVRVFLSDPEEDVVHAALPALQQLTNWAPALGSETLQKLAQVIVRNSKQDGSASMSTSSRRARHRALHDALQVVWNHSLIHAQREPAIGTLIVPAVVPLLDDAHDPETRRLATGLLATLAVSNSGKSALLAQPGAVAQACHLSLDRQAASASAIATAVRDNAVALVRNFSESAQGLHAVGQALIGEPEALLDTLGATRTAKVLERRLAAVAPLTTQVEGTGTASASVSASSASSPSLSSPSESLATLRALLVLLKSGVPRAEGGAGAAGATAAWGILDVVPTLHRITRLQSQVEDGAQSQTDPRVQLSQLARRALLLLCVAEPDAAETLASIGRTLDRATLAREDIFALVAGNTPQARQMVETVAAARRAVQQQQERQQQQEEREAAEARQAAAAREAEAEAARMAEEEAARAQEQEQAALEPEEETPPADEENEEAADPDGESKEDAAVVPTEA